MRSFVTTLILFAGAITLSCQNEAKKWYFGNKAGLDFMSNPPVSITGSMVTGEGCASISDASGSILFYTSGLTVWDKTHNVMANGTGLMGNGSTTQSGTIIKQPGNNSLYYVFTLDDVAGPDGYRYSIVDMSLAAGLGSVTVKNVPIHAPSCEKIAAVKHCNGTDIWVITHDAFSDTFRVNLVTAAGYSVPPVLTAIGPTINTNVNTLGQMKISPNGRMLGMAVYDNFLPGFELFNFDPATGVISNYVPLGTFPSAYGCEFSPDGTKFYGVRYGGTAAIFQWDLCAGTPSAIVASQYSIVTTNVSLASMQLGPDGKLYIARTGQQYLGVINTPNVYGAGCGFVDVGPSTAPNNCQLGLPNFVNSFFKPILAPFGNTVNCGAVNFTPPATGGTVNLGCTAGNYSATGFWWNFGDPGSGTANTSTLTNPVHNYTAAGTYTAMLVAYYACSSDTVRVPVVIASVNPSLAVAGSATLCSGEKRTYTVSGANSYSWTVPSGSTTATTASILLSPTVSGQYTVTGTNSLTGCKSTKTLSVTVLKCTVLNENDGMKDLLFYPNPMHGYLQIESSSATEIEIRSNMGIVVWKEMIPPGTTQLDLSALAPGIYFMHAKRQNSVIRSRIVNLQ